MLVLRSVLFLSMVLGTGRVLAEPFPYKARLEYTLGPGTESCPSEDMFKNMVRSHMDFDPFSADAPARAIVRITAAGRRGQFEGLAELRDRDGALLYTRPAAPSDCMDVSDALSYGLALTLGPPGFQPPSEPPIAAGPPTTMPSLPAALLEVAPLMIKAQPRDRTPRAFPARPAHTTPLWLGLEGGGAIVLQTPPFQIAGQLAAGFVMRWPFIEMTIEGQWLSGEFFSQGFRMIVSRVSGGIVPCIHRGIVFGCATLQAGALFGTSAVVNPRTGVAGHFTTGGRLMLEHSLHERVKIRASLDVQWNFVPPAASIDYKRVWVASPLSAALGAWVVTFF